MKISLIQANGMKASMILDLKEFTLFWKKIAIIKELLWRKDYEEKDTGPGRVQNLTQKMDIEKMSFYPS